MSSNAEEIINATTIATPLHKLPWKVFIAELRNHENLDFMLVISSVGLIAFTLNLLIVIVILRYQALRSRKEYIMMLVLAGADCFYGSTAVHFVWMYGIRIARHMHTKLQFWQCAVLPHIVMWRTQNILQGLMLLVISLDRRLSVVIPIRYYWHGKKYAVRMILTAYCITAVFVCSHFIYPFTTEGTYIADCWEYGQHPWYRTIGHGARSFLSVLSVLIFSTIPCLLHRQQQKTVAACNNNEVNQISFEQAQKVQRAILKTFAISAVVTLTFDAAPHLISTLVQPQIKYFGQTLESILHQVDKINGIANFFIYAVRHKEFRHAVGAFFKCRTLPKSVDAWTVMKSTGKAKITTPHPHTDMRNAP